MLPVFHRKAHGDEGWLVQFDVDIFNTTDLQAIFFWTGFVNKSTKSIHMVICVFNTSISEVMSVNIECIIEFCSKLMNPFISVNSNVVIKTEASAKKMWIINNKNDMQGKSSSEYHFHHMEIFVHSPVHPGLRAYCGNVTGYSFIQRTLRHGKQNNRHHSCALLASSREDSLTNVPYKCASYSFCISVKIMFSWNLLNINDGTGCYYTYVFCYSFNKTSKDKFLSKPPESL